jgi:hypothetical protein
MNGSNSKNMTFIILFGVILAGIFIYALIFNYNQDIIYTDLNELELED